MKLKNALTTWKKVPYYLSLILLTGGASLILGLLSFSGMYALIPFLPLAFAAFFLSAIYEGWIYLVNITNSFFKLFEPDYVKHQVAKEYLLAEFPENTSAMDCPQFFRDYEAALRQLEAFEHKNLDEESTKKKEQMERVVSDMEQWFTFRLFRKKKKDEEEQKQISAYELELLGWLERHKQDEWETTLKNRRIQFHLVAAFSVLAASFMALGSTYLIMEAFTVIPAMGVIPLAFWPALIIPMALISGIAYGMLTYNAVTDLINNDTIVRWYKKLRDDLSQGVSVRNIFMTISVVLLVILAVALTICTAGTWWTVATNAEPLFQWMKKIPTFVMGIINPIVTGLSAIFFNIQNTAESLEIVDETLKSKKNIFQKIGDWVAETWQRLRSTENWGQILNPFRLIIKLTFIPVRIVLFLGHIASIALTADRMPGVPQPVAAATAGVSELIEDAHNFIPKDHHHGHEHDHEANEQSEQVPGAVPLNKKEKITATSVPGMTQADGAEPLLNKHVPGAVPAEEQDQHDVPGTTPLRKKKPIYTMHAPGSVHAEEEHHHKEHHHEEHHHEEHHHEEHHHEEHHHEEHHHEGHHHEGHHHEGHHHEGHHHEGHHHEGHHHEGHHHGKHHHHKQEMVPGAVHYPHTHSSKSLLQERLGGSGGHDHGVDIPTLILKFLMAPLYFLAALWDYAFSQINSTPATPSSDPKKEGQEEAVTPQPLSFTEAWNKHWDIPKEEHVELDPELGTVSEAGLIEQVTDQINQYRDNYLASLSADRPLIHKKVARLEELKRTLRDKKPEQSVANILETAAQEGVYNQHRLFKSSEPTTTGQFVDDLVGAYSAAPATASAA